MQLGLRQFEIRLPIGFTDNSGKVHRKGILRKMCGYDEELLYDQSLNGGHLVTELLKNCLIRLGDNEEIDSMMISQLYTADRNYLLLELRRITLGDTLQVSYLCPHCKSHFTTMENLSEVPFYFLADGEPWDDIEITLDDGFQDRHGNIHRDLILTLPSGVDEEFVAPMMSKDPFKAQNALLLRCIKKFGTLPKAELDAYGVKILRELTIGDRKILQTSLSENVPGIDLQRIVHCINCHNEFKGVIDVSNFFSIG